MGAEGGTAGKMKTLEAKTYIKFLNNKKPIDKEIISSYKAKLKVNHVRQETNY